MPYAIVLTRFECTSAFNIHETVTCLCNICLLFSECLREDIIYENTELVAKASYTDGETVKVNCMTGYIGSYKLKCENGQWKKMVGRSCASKWIVMMMTASLFGLLNQCLCRVKLV